MHSCHGLSYCYRTVSLRQKRTTRTSLRTRRTITNYPEFCRCLHVFLAMVSKIVRLYDVKFSLVVYQRGLWWVTNHLYVGLVTSGRRVFGSHHHSYRTRTTFPWYSIFLLTSSRRWNELVSILCDCIRYLLFDSKYSGTRRRSSRFITPYNEYEHYTRTSMRFSVSRSSFDR